MWPFEFGVCSVRQTCKGGQAKSLYARRTGRLHHKVVKWSLEITARVRNRYLKIHGIYFLLCLSLTIGLHLQWSTCTRI